MKKIILISSFLVFNLISIIAQNTLLDSSSNLNYTVNKKQLDSLKTELKQTINTQIDSIKQFILNNSDDTKTTIGTIGLRNLNVMTYKRNARVAYEGTFDNNTGLSNCDTIYYDIKEIDTEKGKCKCRPKEYISFKYTKIDSIHFRVESGEIITIQIFADGKIYFNKDAPIIISSKRFSQVDRLIQDLDNNVVIILKDVLKYANYKSFFPDNVEVTLNKDKQSYSFKKSSGVNDFFDARLYSDALGVFANTSNGLVQTDILGKYAVGRLSYPNKGMRFLKYVGFNLTAAKFDSKIAYTPSNDFKRIDLFQKRWLNINAFTTIASGWLNKGSSDTYGVEYGFGVDLSNIANSKDTFSSLSTYHFLRGYTNFFISDNFNIDFSLKYFIHNNYDSEKLNKNSFAQFLQPSLALYWFPSTNKSSRIFAKANYTLHSEVSNSEFFQIQFGYSVLFSSLLK